MDGSVSDISKTIETEMRLSTYTGEDEVISSQDNYNRLRSTSKPNFICSSGMPSLDKLIVGFHRGELNALGGPAKHGKTSVAQSFSYHFAENEKNMLWFSYEVSALQFLEQFDPLPKFFMPKVLKSNSLEWLSQRIWETKLKYGLDFVFIDHLHYLIDMNKKNNVSLEIGHVMRTLKKIAIRFNIAVFLIAHLTKLKLDDEPDADSFRDSSFVVQECDNAFLIWRLKNKTGDFTNDAILKIGANRRFGIMEKKIRLKKIDSRLREVAYSD